MSRLQLKIGLSVLWFGLITQLNPLQASPGVNIEDLATVLAIPRKDLPRLEQGEIVPFPVGEATSKSVAGGVAAYVRTPPGTVADLIRRGKLLATDPEVVMYGELGADTSVDAFGKFDYGVAQMDEVRDLLEVTAASDFNLSGPEIASFNALKSGADKLGDLALAKAVSRNYRRILAARLAAYRKSGLGGMAGYERGDGDRVDPATELGIDTRDNTLLSHYFPGMKRALAQFPNAVPADVDSRYLWVNRIVEKRPTPILVHRLSGSTDAGAVMVQREFYVGHSYNSSQVVVACLPYRDGTLMLYGVRSSTDQVAGVGEAWRHAVGRERLRNQITRAFKRLKAALGGRSGAGVDRS